MTPIYILLSCIIFLAAINKSIGVRRAYVKILLKIFEYGRQNIETAKRKTRQNYDNQDTEDDGNNEDDVITDNNSSDDNTQQKQNGETNELHENFDKHNTKDGLINGKLPNGNGIIKNKITLTPSKTVSVATVNATASVAEARAIESAITSSSSSTTNSCHSNHNNINNNNNSHNNGNSLITRDTFILLPDGDIKENNCINNKTKLNSGEVKNNEKNKETDNDEISFNLSRCLDYIKAGVEAIIEDEVTSRFEAEELKNWNLLTRTNRHYEFITWKLSVIWMCGFVIRYFILMPLRVFICFIGVIWLTICTALVGSMPDGDSKRKMVQKVLSHCFGVLSSAISAVINYHNIENRPKKGICVANHTSPIDVLVLMCDNTYSLIGQRHGGFLGILQRALARASPHIWFERAEAKDRHAVAQRLRQHVSDPKNPPILIFPEGTCINNTSVMQFKKGSFEVGGTIYPVAIKYDARFGDAFWNSSRFSMLQYLYMMMTSWAIVCDVWYLPPMYQKDDETAIDFANRVKSVIAKQGGLVDLVWDGQLKRIKPKKEWKEKQQIEFTKRLKGE